MNKGFEETFIPVRPLNFFHFTILRFASAAVQNTAAYASIHSFHCHHN